MGRDGRVTQDAMLEAGLQTSAAISATAMPLPIHAGLLKKMQLLGLYAL